MFNTTLRQRSGLESLVPQLLSCHDPSFKERLLETHDLAIPARQPSTANLTAASRPQQRPLAPPPKPPDHYLFLLFTPNDLTPANEPATLDRIARFSTLTAFPPPTIALILQPDPSCGGPTEANSSSTEKGFYAYSRLQILLHAPLPDTTASNFTSNTPISNPIPTLPIPSPSTLLPLLKSYMTNSPSQVTSPAIQNHALHHLLPHTTTTAPDRTLPQHTANVLSDLCHSIREVAWICEREEGRRMLVEWIGKEGAEAIVRFWNGEWVVGE